MQIKEFIERKRDVVGRFSQTIEGGWRTKSNLYQKRYLKSHPWAKYYYYSKSRHKRIGVSHTMKVGDFKHLWDRDQAWKLEFPSIDRIDPSGGYNKDNCRFIERSENTARAQRGRKPTKKQREVARKNIIKWARSPERIGEKRGPYKK